MLRLFSLLLSLAGILFFATVAAGALVFTGSPDACVDRAVTPSAEASSALVSAWRDFESAAVAGGAEITVTELQATSRGVEYIEEKDVPVEDLQVYFCPDGTAEASGKIVVAGLKGKIVVRGTLDLGGDKPGIQIDEIQAGNLPSALAKPAIDLILNTGNFRTLDLDVRLTSIEYGDGAATVTGEP
ncbi:MAG: hypothetical protein GEU75_01175 [Dehalococcoidia bacterium]|nr:hypothetical protein [Dehalococcoidia bacterium]